MISFQSSKSPRIHKDDYASVSLGITHDISTRCAQSFVIYKVYAQESCNRVIKFFEGKNKSHSALSQSVIFALGHSASLLMFCLST